MPKQGAQKQGKHKDYGPKMAAPRIVKSKEKRQCGPIGYALRAQEARLRYTHRRDAMNNACAHVIKAHPQSRIDMRVYRTRYQPEPAYA